MNKPTIKPRKHLSADALNTQLRAQFEELPDPTTHTSNTSLADALMSGFAMFSLKDPSLLAFQQRRTDKNMKRVFHIEHVPCDTHMRTLCDEVDPLSFAPAFKGLFSQVQRGKVLEPYRFIDGSYLLLLDGVEYFRSDKVHCPKCMEQHHRDGRVSYYHQMVQPVIAHPKLDEVIPLMPEPIQRQDGSAKGDCERNAAKRLLLRISKDHPHLRFTITEDALSANGPHIRLIQDLKWNYILVVKPNDHQLLFGLVEAAAQAGTLGTYQYVDPCSGVIKRYRWLLQVPLNASHPDLLVNFLEYWELNPKSEVIYHNTWVTNFDCTRDSVAEIVRGGRARWKIENETFNTLKNQGYHFEHNFGHGLKNLSVVFAMLMILAFFVDQIQQICNPVFRAAWQKCGTKRALWEELRIAFRAFVVTSMWELYELVCRGYVKLRPVLLDDS